MMAARFFVLACGCAVAMGMGPDDSKRPEAGGPAAAGFEKIKALAGVWHTPDADKDGAPDQTITYRVVSAGSAVLETIMPGTEHEMVTLYTLDRESIVVTHYCALGNQPRMRAAPALDAAAIEFNFIDGTNIASKMDPHMGKLILTFKDKDHFSAVWTLFKDAKIDHEMLFELTRDPNAKVTSSAVGGACCEAAG